jgi:hypothetical protein
MSRKVDRREIEKHTKHNQGEVSASDTCGCLTCLSTFAPEKIKEWIDEDDPELPQDAVDRTAVCPHCGEAMIIGDSSGHQISRTFLEAMRMR